MPTNTIMPQRAPFAPVEVANIPIGTAPLGMLASKVLVKENTSTLFPAAKAVEIQVELNPPLISEYHLIG